MLINRMTLGKLSNHPVPPFLHKLNKNDRSNFVIQACYED